MGVTTPPWWTQADEAELSVLVHGLIDELDAHACPTCDGHTVCPGVQKGIQLVIDWKHNRDRASLAAWLRARQTASEQHLELVA